MSTTTTAAAVSERPRGPTLRQRLLLMALGLTIPAAVFMGLLVAAEYQQGARRFEQQLVATTRALAFANDRQLAQGEAVLRALAVSPALELGDLKAFEDQARKVDDGPAWIVLQTIDRQLVNTLLPRGAPLPRTTLPPATWEALRRGQTLVSDLAQGTVAGQPIVAIDKPVLSKGQLLVLSYIQRPDNLRPLFAAQKLSPAWVGSIVDRKGVLVARSRDHGRLLGRSATPDMLAAMRKSSEGMVATRTLDGVPTYSAFSRSPTYGWSFIVGVPREEFQRVTVAGVGLVAVAAGALLAIGAGAAVVFARGISREMRSLMADARGLVSGAEIQTRPDELWETAQVRQALQEASRELKARQAANQEASARQQLMIHELNHRVKNTLATVQSLAHQSLRGAEGDPRSAAFTERLQALAKAHDLLTERVWEGAGLEDVVRRTLKPYEAQAEVAGPAIALAPNAAVGLSMVFHELGTNAAKYGALTVESGRIAVAWSLDTEEGPLRLVWRERGGPPVAPPGRSGFGTRLIHATVAGELHGMVMIEPEPEGLVCTLILPLSDAIGPSGGGAVIAPWTPPAAWG